jgi:hypothetical protein
MEYWEFLLQGEGDQNWLPLDASQVEILEGRYRVMAHTSQTDTAVDIRISQLLLDHTPPKRRSLKRQGQTQQRWLAGGYALYPPDGWYLEHSLLRSDRGHCRGCLPPGNMRCSCRCCLTNRATTTIGSLTMAPPRSLPVMWPSPRPSIFLAASLMSTWSRWQRQ